MMKVSKNAFFDECIRSTSNKNFHMPTLVRDKAEAALREYRDGDLDTSGLRDAAEDVKAMVAQQLNPERVLWGAK